MKRLEKNGEVILKRFNCNLRVPSYVTPEWLSLNHPHLKSAIVVDLETTGLDRSKDKIIEIGIRHVKFDRRNGDIIEVLESYNSFQDPQIEIPKAVCELTGLSNAVVKDQQIDWTKVSEFFKVADVVIAHNAEFERSFLDREVPQSSSKIWACSLLLIDWRAKGFNTHKLEVLSYYHGFYVDSHRAMNDVDALIYLLSFSDDRTTKPYLFELLEAVKQPKTKIQVLGSSYESKDLLKNRGYRWDIQSKAWYKSMPQCVAQEEVKWIEEFIYHGPFAGSMQPIRICDQFKGT